MKLKNFRLLTVVILGAIANINAWRRFRRAITTD